MAANTLSPYPFISRPASSYDRRFAQYWYLDDHTDSFLEVKNHLDSALVLVARLRLFDGEMLELEPITVRPFTTKRLSIKKQLSSYTEELPQEEDAVPLQGTRWGDGSRQNSLLGNVELFPIYPGDAAAEDFSAWVVIEDPIEGLALVHPFRLPPHAASTILDSVWWRPYPEVMVYYILQNTHSVETKVDLAIFSGDGNEILTTRALVISPFGLRLVALHDLLPNELGSVGGVRFFCDVDDESATRTILARGMLIDENRGFSSPLWIHGFRGALPSDKATELHGVGLLFGNAKVLLPRSRAIIHPHLLLRNVTERPIEITLVTGGRDQYGRVSDFRLAKRLDAGSAMHLDLEMERRQSRSDIADGVGTLRLTHNGNPTDVVAELVNVDETGDFCLYDRVVNLHSYDVTTLTAISFSLSDDRRTFLILKNVTDGIEQARILVDYAEGKECYEQLVEVEAQDFAVIDLERLRTDRVPDRYGKSLPEEVVFGGCVILATTPGALIASDPTFLRPPAEKRPGGDGPARLDDDGFSCIDITGAPGGGGGGGGGSGGGPKKYPRSPFKTPGCLKARRCQGPCRGCHSGVDVFFAGLDTGDPVVAMETGTVIDVMGSKERGDETANAVIVRDRSGFITVYSHVKPIASLKGKTVQRGSAIGQVDLSGQSSSPHVHIMRLAPGRATYQDIIARVRNGDYLCNFELPACTQV